jgi:hypothetical protein
MPARKRLETKFKSERVGGDTTDLTEHLWQCPTCEAWVDMRDLGAMIEHGEPLPHPPGLPVQ